MNLALTADWLPTFGGAEHVIAALHRLWPDAPLYTSIYDCERLPALASADVRVMPLLQRAYRLTRRHRWLLPILPSAFERIDLSGFDVIISSSHAVAKGIIPPSSAIHVCYCHTPMRYAWEMEDAYIKDFRLRGIVRSMAKRFLKKTRRWDLSTARRVDVFIANSTETQERIARIYGRESVVIPPPVDERFFATQLAGKHEEAKEEHSKGLRNTYFLAIGRLVPYKRFDLVIELANALKMPLKIAGTGHDRARLQSLAGATVEFLGHVSDAELPELYRNAEALLFPQVEDAGVVPLEAQASGLPVIAYGKGGILDVIEPKNTGILASEQTVDAFRVAIDAFKATRWNRQAIRESARAFSEEAFRTRILAEIERAAAGKRFLRHTSINA